MDLPSSNLGHSKIENRSQRLLDDASSKTTINVI
jgi:hypothetical protein